MKTCTIGLVVVLAALGANVASAHCDTLDGPVVIEAKAALEKGDVTPVLKWVKRNQEPEIRQAFDKCLVVRAKGADAKELADHYFLETLVRLHRESEGAPYTGLKPAGADLGPAVVGADKAIQTGEVDGLIKLMTDSVSDGIKERFAEVVEKKKHADHNVEAGREYVAAYVEFVHYVERLHLDAQSNAAHHETESAKEVQEHKH